MSYRALIRKIRIKNFRSIVDETLKLENFNVFVGLNDCGKSNVLKALNLFFNDETEPDQPLDFPRDYCQHGKTGKGKAKEIVIELYIGIYDKMYYELMQLNNSDQDIPYKYRILDYGYPVFIRIFYDKDFASLPGVVLKPVDGELLLLLNKVLYINLSFGWFDSDDVLDLPMYYLVIKKDKVSPIFDQLKNRNRTRIIAVDEHEEALALLKHLQAKFPRS